MRPRAASRRAPASSRPATGAALRPRPRRSSAAPARCPTRAGARSRPTPASCARRRSCRPRRPVAGDIAGEGVAVRGRAVGSERRQQRPGARPRQRARAGRSRLRAPAEPPTGRQRRRAAPPPRPGARASAAARRASEAARAGGRRVRARPPSRNPPFASNPTASRAPFGGERRDGLDDVGRADPGAARPREPAAALERGAGVDRRRHRVGAERPRRQDAERCRRAARAPVSSAISGRSPSPSVETSASSRCSATHAPIRRATPAIDGLGVDRHEGRRSARAAPPRRRAAPAPPRGGRGPRRCAGRRRRGETAQRARSEEVDVALDVGLSDLDRLGRARRAARPGAGAAAAIPASSALVISPSGR